MNSDPTQVFTQWTEAMAQAAQHWAKHSQSPSTPDLKYPFGTMPPLAAGMPSPTLQANLPAMPEPGWWWLPKVPAQAWASAFTRWFTPGSDISDLVKGDRRFRAEAWEQDPYFRGVSDQYLRTAAFWRELVEQAELNERERHRARFFLEQALDAAAPTNFFLTNPEAIRRALETKGESIRHGLENLQHDIEAGHISMTDEKAFAVGVNLATTPGEVVFRNELIELLHFTPTQKQVFERPLLIVPPCINKYYILDLKPENSFVAHAVAAGFDVYLISWKNVGEDQRATTWDDYLEAGVLTAIDETREHANVETVNALGFCVGGTILSSALGVLAARGELEDFVHSMTLLTTLLDFTEPGDIKAYLGESTYQMRVQQLGPDGSGGLIKGSELAQSFASLRANDLIWNYVVNNYLKGQDPPAFDLLYWNSDSTNLPGAMYLYYIRNFYLDNRLTQPGSLEMLGEPIDLGDIAIDAYVYASREDHIVPWKSAYASAELLGGTIEFVLGASGHIAGVINPPGPKKRSFWTSGPAAPDADTWEQRATEHPGSWWPHWHAWLGQRSGPKVPARKHKPRRLGKTPGQYVLEKA